MVAEGGGNEDRVPAVSEMVRPSLELEESRSAKLAGEGRRGKVVESEDNSLFGERRCCAAVSLAAAVFVGDEGLAFGAGRSSGVRTCVVLTGALSEPKSGNQPMLQSLVSDCFLKLASSGLRSRGITCGECAAVERTLELGALHLDALLWTALDGEVWPSMGPSFSPK